MWVVADADIGAQGYLPHLLLLCLDALPIHTVKHKHPEGGGCIY